MFSKTDFTSLNSIVPCNITETVSDRYWIVLYDVNNHFEGEVPSVIMTDGNNARVREEPTVSERYRFFTVDVSDYAIPETLSFKKVTESMAAANVTLYPANLVQGFTGDGVGARTLTLDLDPRCCVNKLWIINTDNITPVGA